MSNILIVSEHFLNGGVETYIKTQVLDMKKEGHNCFLITDSCSDLQNINIFQQVIANVKLGLNSDFNSFISTVKLIDEFINKNDIDIVHVHPFYSIIPAILAAKKNKKRIWLTLHGPISLDYYGDIQYQFILKHFLSDAIDQCLVVSEEVENLCKFDFIDSVRIQRNPINKVNISNFNSIENDRVLIVSRLDSDKISGLIDGVKYISSDSNINEIDIVGCGDSVESLKNEILQLVNIKKVNFLGFNENVEELFFNYRYIAGMGRSALESIYSDKPTLLIGYDGVKGLIDDLLFENLMKSNFSGRNVDNISLDKFISESKTLPIVSLELKERYLSETDWPLFDDINKEFPLAVDIVNILYQQEHVASSHSYLNTPEFVSILNNVIFSKKHFRYDIVFNYIRMFNVNAINQLISLEKVDFQSKLSNENINSNKVDDINNKVDDIINKVDDILNININKINNLQEDIVNIKMEMSNSMSFKKYIQHGKRYMYQIVKSLYWKLPSRLRWKLNGVRHSVVRRFRRIPVEPITPISMVGIKDLTWEQFKENVLKYRDYYKGVFIQEVVIDWDVPLYQRPQHIATAFGQLDYLVIYRTTNFTADNVNGFRQVSKNVWLTNAPEVNNISGAVRSFYSTAYSLEASDIDKLAKNSTIVYEYIDHIDPAISGDDENIKRLLTLKDKCFNGTADYIVASAKKLEEEALCFFDREKVILAQNGVDTAHYRNNEHNGFELPQEIIQFRKKYEKIVGYFGAIAPWLWYEEIEKLVLLRPDVGFIFIGPDYYGGVDKLVKAENVLHLGAVNYQNLPSYARTFDVCFIPFEPCEIARTTSPLKLFEYFALEKPVVVTSEMRECIVYDEVLRSDSAEGFSSEIDKALVLSKDPIFKSKLASLADENSWCCRALAMSPVFEKK
ncbi:glycosyltransferase [Photobacterium kishitanii]|uniref:glycosyltransferase n=1 Tax=Photobacterium kishitanii TaxID=318456 RepID=UPI0015E78745|nr:glycosyltransferase [Photobacterium kishitanii]